jgi:serine/threonine-protein kinase
MQAIRPGSTFYHYVVLGQLGAGFHGEVYEIRHRLTGAIFALKVIHTQDRALPNRVARALAAAKGNYQVQHQNVLLVHDLNCESNGLVWMRTERLFGQTVQELLHGSGTLSLPFVVQAGIQAAHGLHAIHEAQIVHRDVKPSNLFYTRERALKVIDFSIAKVFPEGLETTAGRVGMGTPAYMAPEQLEQAHARPDPRVDVYGLGISLWEMLAGKNPFHDVLANPEALIKCQITRMPARLSEVARLPSEVDEVLAKALAKDPSRRFATMGQFARALMDLQDWLTAEARAGRVVVTIPAGEPPMPGDPNAWRDYRPPQALPPNEPDPLSGPRAKVILAEARAASETRADEAGQAPTPPALATRQASTTVPLPVTSPLAVTSPSAGSLPSATASPLQATKEALAGFDARRSSASLPCTPLVASRSVKGEVRSPRRVPWPAVIAIVVATSSLTIVATLWSARRVDRPGFPGPAGTQARGLDVVASSRSAAKTEPPSPSSSPLRDEADRLSANASTLPVAGPAASALATASAPAVPSAVTTVVRRVRPPSRELPGSWPPREQPFTPGPTHRAFDLEP